METPSSRDSRAFFHFERSAKLRNRIKISTFSRSLRSFQAASIGPGIKVVLSLKRHADGTKSFRKNKGGSCRSSRSSGRSVNKVFRVKDSRGKWGLSYSVTPELLQLL